MYDEETNLIIWIVRSVLFKFLILAIRTTVRWFNSISDKQGRGKDDR